MNSTVIPLPPRATHDELSSRNLLTKIAPYLEAIAEALDLDRQCKYGLSIPGPRQVQRLFQLDGPEPASALIVWPTRYGRAHADPDCYLTFDAERTCFAHLIEQEERLSEDARTFTDRFYVDVLELFGEHACVLRLRDLIWDLDQNGQIELVSYLLDDPTCAGVEGRSHGQL